MKLVRIIFVSAIVTIVTQFAWGQGRESLAFGLPDLVKPVKIYPNPAVDYVSLRFEMPVAREVTLELHSIIGNSLEVESEIVDDYEIRIKVKDLTTGYYLLDVKGSQQRGTYKFLKR